MRKYVEYKNKIIVIDAVILALFSASMPVVIKAVGSLDPDKVSVLELILNLVPLLAIKIAYAKVHNVYKSILIDAVAATAIFVAILVVAAEYRSLEVLGYFLYLKLLLLAVTREVKEEAVQHYEHVKIRGAGKRALRLLRKKFSLYTTYASIAGSVTAVGAINIVQINPIDWFIWVTIGLIILTIYKTVATFKML